MEFGTPQFWVAGLEIIVINILLSGDNAVVIALACRNLPKRQRRLGIFYGVIGAVVLRVLLVFCLVVSIPLVVVGAQIIMKIIERFPILVIAGGGLLGWIAGEIAVADYAVKDWIAGSAPQLHWVAPVVG